MTAPAPLVSAPTSSAGPLPTPNPGVVYRALPDGGVLFSAADEVYFGLNATGAFIWEQLPPASATFDALCGAVCARFPDADPERVPADVGALLAALAENGLVTTGRTA